MSTVFFFWFLALITNIQSRPFYAYSYDEIVVKLEKWQTDHPNIFKLYTAKEKYNLFLPNSVECSKKYGNCQHHIVIITNHQTWNNDLSRPHVFLSGALHGNERVGPTTLIELIDYLLFEYHNNKNNLWINYLINNRVIILTPMTNPIGYAQSTREERAVHSKLDPNRDFPYMNKPSGCMKTITGRTINEIFREYLIQIAITFHGGMRAISYEWGAPNHKTPKDYSPDHIAQVQLVSNMQVLGGHLLDKNKWYYPIGTLNKVVYAVSGGMEDWAYGGSWDKENVGPCEPSTYNTYPKERTVYNNAMLRAFNFLIEASDAKIPTSNWGHIKNDWDDIWKIDNHQYDGHIPRNIRISMFVINSVMPYVMIQKHPLIIMNEQNTKQLNWFVSGAMSLYAYDVLFAMKRDVDTFGEIEWNVLELEKNPMWRKNLDLISDHNMESKVFKFSIEVETNLTEELMEQIVSKCNVMDNFIKTEEDKVFCPVWLSIRVKVDDQWKDNRDLNNWKIVKTYPEGVPPQSHVVNARNEPRDKWNMTNNKYYVMANKWWYAVKPIRTDIYFVYDDQNKTVSQSHISWAYIVLVLCVIGVVVYSVIYKYRYRERNRRRMGNKTYQRVPQISIV